MKHFLLNMSVAFAALSVGIAAAYAQTPAYPANTTDITTDLYVRHAHRVANDEPALAHCRQINVSVNGRMQSRRQCVTPADNY